MKYIERVCETGADIIAFEDPAGSFNIPGPKYFEILGRDFTYSFIRNSLVRIGNRGLLHLYPKLLLQLISLGLAKWREIESEKPVGYVEANVNLKDKISVSGTNVYIARI